MLLKFRQKGARHVHRASSIEPLLPLSSRGAVRRARGRAEAGGRVAPSRSSLVTHVVAAGAATSFGLLLRRLPGPFMPHAAAAAALAGDVEHREHFSRSRDHVPFRLPLQVVLVSLVPCPVSGCPRTVFLKTDFPSSPPLGRQGGVRSFPLTNLNFLIEAFF